MATLNGTDRAPAPSDLDSTMESGASESTLRSASSRKLDPIAHLSHTAPLRKSTSDDVWKATKQRYDTQEGAQWRKKTSATIASANGMGGPGGAAKRRADEVDALMATVTGKKQGWEERDGR